MASFFNSANASLSKHICRLSKLASKRGRLMGASLCLQMLLGLAATSVHAAAQTDEAQQAASAFFLEYMTLRQQDKVAGLPSMQQLDTLAPHFIPKLHRIFYIALREQYRCRGRDKTAPWSSGDLFSSSDLGFNSFTVGPSVANQYGRQAKVTFTLQHNGKTLRWDDEAIMRKEDGKWLLYDIEYHGQFARTKRGKSLQSVIDKNPAC